MATDILLYVERLAGGRWECLPPPRRDLARYPRGDLRSFEARLWGPHDCMAEWTCYGAASGCVDGNCAACRVTDEGRSPSRRWFRNRNYFLFAILAGVRNTDELVPISHARGCPPDVSLHVRSRLLEYGNSWSWLRLDEVLAFDWDRMSSVGSDEPLTYRELAADFLAFIDELVLPLLGASYAQVKAIANDAAESGHPAYAEIAREALQIASTIRFVFGFD